MAPRWRRGLDHSLRDPQVGDEVVQGEAVVREAVVVLRDRGEPGALLRERTTMPCGGAKRLEHTGSGYANSNLNFRFETQIRISNVKSKIEVSILNFEFQIRNEFQM